MSRLRSAADGNEPFRVWLIRALEEFLSSDPIRHVRRHRRSGCSRQSERAVLPAVPGYESSRRSGWVAKARCIVPTIRAPSARSH